MALAAAGQCSRRSNADSASAAGRDAQHCSSRAISSSRRSCIQQSPSRAAAAVVIFMLPRLVLRLTLTTGPRPQAEITPQTRDIVNLWRTPCTRTGCIAYVRDSQSAILMDCFVLEGQATALGFRLRTVNLQHDKCCQLINWICDRTFSELFCCFYIG